MDTRNVELVNNIQSKAKRFFERLNAMLRGDLPEDENFESMQIQFQMQ